MRRPAPKQGGTHHPTAAGGGGGGAGGGVAAGGSNLTPSASAGGLVHAAAVKPLRDSHHHHAGGLGSAGSGDHGGAAGSSDKLYDMPVGESFEVHELDLSAAGASTTLIANVTRERRVDFLPGIVLLRASVRPVGGAAGAAEAGAATVSAAVSQGGAIVKAVAHSDEPRVVLYLDSGWYHILDRNGLSSQMLLLPRKNANRAFAAALEKQLHCKLVFAPRMSSDLNLPIGVSFPSHTVFVTEDGQIRDTAAAYEDEIAAATAAAQASKAAAAGGGGDHSPSGTAGGAGGAAGGEVVAAAAVDFSLIRDLELRRLLEATSDTTDADVQAFANFGVLSLSPAIVETSTALLAATQASNPFSRVITKLAETIGAALTSHEIQGRMHLAVPVVRAAVTAFQALLHLARHSPVVCAQGPGDAIGEAVERCVGALLVGGFEACLGMPEQTALMNELAQHLATAILMLTQTSTSSSSSSSSSTSAAAQLFSSGANASNVGGGLTAAVAPIVSRAFLLMSSMLAPLPAATQRILDSIADAHASQVIFATHSTQSLFAGIGGSLTPSRLIDSYVALGCSVALAQLAVATVNVWSARMVDAGAMGFGVSLSAGGSGGVGMEQRRGSSSSSSFVSGGGDVVASSSSSASSSSYLGNLSGQVVIRAATTALSLATQLLESAISERALAAITGRSVVNRESAAQAATALLTSRRWADGTKQAMCRVFDLDVRLCEAVVFLTCFSGVDSSRGGASSMCYDQAVNVLATPLRRMASWYGTIFPPELGGGVESGSSRQQQQQQQSSSHDNNNSSGNLSLHSGGAMRKALREAMTRAACRFLTARAAVDGMIPPIGAGDFPPGASWLVRCAVLCGAAALRTEMIGACAVLLRLQVIAATVLLVDHSASSGRGSSSSTSSLLFHSGVASNNSKNSGGESGSNLLRNPLGKRRALGGSGSGGGGGFDFDDDESKANSSNNANNDNVAASNTQQQRREKARGATRLELMQRSERVWGRLQNQLAATLNACPQPSTAHSVWSMASLLVHRFSQACMMILHKSGSATYNQHQMQVNKREQEQQQQQQKATATTTNTTPTNTITNAALICASLILSVPQVEALSSFSGGDFDDLSLGPSGGGGGGAAPHRPPDAAAYLASDAWDGLAEFENERPGALGLDDGAWQRQTQDYALAATTSVLRLGLAPSVQDEAFFYIDKSCEDENENARLMTASRRRLRAVQDARDSAAAPPSRCAWFAARAIRDFARAFFRASQDLFDDVDTVALVCAELANLFFFGSGVQHASMALQPVLACVRQIGDEEASASSRQGSPSTMTCAEFDFQIGSSSSSAGDVPVRRRHEDPTSPAVAAVSVAGPSTANRWMNNNNSKSTTAATSNSTSNQQQSQQQQQGPRRTPLKRESVLVSTLRAQRMLNQNAEPSYHQ